LTDRWLAMRSASSPGFSICGIAARASGRHLLVQLHIVFELLDDRAAERLGLGRAGAVLADVGDLGFVEVGAAGEVGDAGAGPALDQHLHRAVRQFQQLQDGGDDADVIDGARRRIVVVLVLLGGQKDFLALGLHGFFQRAHRLLATDEKRHRLGAGRPRCPAAAGSAGSCSRT
jgi:hypothetical protein